MERVQKIGVPVAFVVVEKRLLNYVDPIEKPFGYFFCGLLF